MHFFYVSDQERGRRWNKLYPQPTINIDGLDVVNIEYEGRSVGDGEAGVYAMFGFDPSESDLSALTNSSIRLGIRGDDLWLPEHVRLLLGRQQTPDGTGEMSALAMELDKTVRLSTDQVLGNAMDNTIIRNIILIDTDLHGYRMLINTNDAINA